MVNTPPLIVIFLLLAALVRLRAHILRRLRNFPPGQSELQGQ